mgnify:CR=1 FL=1
MTIILLIPVIKQQIRALIGTEANLGIRDYLVSGIVIVASILFMMLLFPYYPPVADIEPSYSPSTTFNIFFSWIIGAGVALGILVIILIVRIKKIECD